MNHPAHRSVLLLLGLLIAMMGCGGSSHPRSPAGALVTPTVAVTVAPPLVPVALTVQLALAGAECPTDIAWSPDGSRLAVMASHGTCLQRPATKTPDTVLIYDTHSGQLDKQFSIGSILANAGADVPPNSAFGMSPMRWSPDGTQLAVPVLIYSRSPNYGAGLLILPTDGRDGRVLAGGSLFPPDSAGSLPAQRIAAYIWNLGSGQLAIELSLPVTEGTRFAWTPDGRILALPASATPGAGEAFTPWQSGVMLPVPVAAISEPGALPAVYSTYLTQWSPDGRYVAADIAVLSDVDGPSATLLAGEPNACLTVGLPLTCPAEAPPTPDAAYAAAAAHGRAAPYDGRVPLAWREDGKVLAAVWPGDAIVPDQRTLRITLLSTVTGKALAVAAVTAQSPIGDTGTCDRPYFTWSHDGTRLALVSSIDDQVIIWDTTAVAP